MNSILTSTYEYAIIEVIKMIGRVLHMANKRNPYTPGAGRSPAYLAGREKELNDIQGVLDDLADNDCVRSIIFYGLRGVGKTVLLNEIENMCKKHSEIICEHFEAAESSDFKSKFTTSIYKMLLGLSGKERLRDKAQRAKGLLRAFHCKWNPADQEFDFSLDGEAVDYTGRGIVDTGNFSNDLLELLLAVGSAALEESTSLCLLIDEMQYLKKEELEALIGALHRCNQKNIPICIFGAGLPKIAKDAGDAKSYAERLFSFKEIGSLSQAEAAAALVEPARDIGVFYSPDAVQYIVDVTGGYPYFIQEYGRQLWKYTAVKPGDKVTLDTAKAAEQYFWDGLDESFFKVRFDRATPTEQRFMFAMAQCGHTPCNVGEVAEIMNKDTTSIGPVRAQLIHKGLIYATRHGEIDYTVPGFSKYLKRFHPQYFSADED